MNDHLHNPRTLPGSFKSPLCDFSIMLTALSMIRNVFPSKLFDIPYATRWVRRTSYIRPDESWSLELGGSSNVTK